MGARRPRRRVSLLLAAVLCGLSAAAAPGLAGAPRPGAPYWFKTYSTSPYREFWTGELALKDFSSGLPKALALIAENGGSLTQPWSSFASSRTPRTQQLSFTLPRRNARALTKALRRLGRIADPAVSPAGEDIPFDEVRAKIDAIMKEKNERSAALAQVPVAAAAEEEILEHLLMVEELARRTDVPVLFNLQVTGS